VRWSTVGVIWLIVGLGMAWMATSVMATYPVWARTLALVIMGAAGVLLTHWSTNTAKPAEFLIMTESEMRKVVWPSRQIVVNSTKVVIVMTLLMAGLLFGVDMIFKSLAEALKLM
jgi:preprotein translocase subunit SecE